MECKAQQLHFEANDCWTFTLPGMELNDDGYLRYRWEVATDKRRERVVLSEEWHSSEGKLYCAEEVCCLYASLELCSNGELLVTQKRIHLRRGKQIPIRYTISHLCGNRKCFRPGHVITVSHTVFNNYPASNAGNEICWHTPKCLQTFLTMSQKLQLLLQEEVSNDIGTLVLTSL